MKLAFVVHNEYYTSKMMDLLREAGIDYYTRWTRAEGKGHGTEPHTGKGGFSSTNTVVMIAFHDDDPLTALIGGLNTTNTGIPRAADRFRLFVVPLEQMV